MIHLIKSKKGFEVVTVRNGNVVFKTPNQGYETKAGAIKAIRAGMKDFNGGFSAFAHCVIQDDTLDVQKLFFVYGKGKNLPCPKKPKPKYIPQAKVKKVVV